MTVFHTTRRTLLKLIGSLTVFRAAQGAAAGTCTLVPTFALGQMMRYRLESHLVRNGAIGYRSRSTVTLEITDRVTDGWLARWTSSEGELLNADEVARPLLEALQALWNGVSIDLRLDTRGRVRGLAAPPPPCARGVRQASSVSSHCSPTMRSAVAGCTTS